MKKIIPLIVAFVSSVACADNGSFMPQNDLWKEDGLLKAGANIDKPLFDKIVQAGRDDFSKEARQNNETLQINALWSDSTVNANVSRYGGKVTINMYGGLARRPEVIPEGFTLVLCHELGHAYGGAPYIRAESKMSAEGRADYYSTFGCYARIAERVPELKGYIAASDYVLNKCEKDEDCLHALEGGLSLGRLLAVLSRDPEPRFETPDPTVVRTTQLSYPATTQCRVDSYHNGWFKMPMPKCWYAGNNLIPVLW